MRKVLRLLAVIRRMLLGGFLFFLLNVFLLQKDPKSLLQLGLEANSFYSYFSLYLVFSIVAYVVFNIISSIVIKFRGYSATLTPNRTLIETIFKTLGSDIVAPFKCIGGFFTAIFGKYPDVMPDDMVRGSRTISIVRFLWMLIWTAFCIISTLLLP